MSRDYKAWARKWFPHFFIEDGMEGSESEPIEYTEGEGLSEKPASIRIIEQIRANHALDREKGSANKILLETVIFEDNDVEESAEMLQQSSLGAEDAAEANLTKISTEENCIEYGEEMSQEKY